MDDLRASFKRNADAWRLVLTAFLSVVSTVFMMQILGLTNMEMNVLRLH
jgi:hypothetical protein